MEKEIKVGLHNKWEIVVRDKDTGEIKGEYTGHNIILNQFWARFLSIYTTSCLSCIHFGSGSAEPVATDTTLTTFLGAKAIASSIYDTSHVYTDGYASVKKTIRLESTEFIGSTISEVGFGYGTGASNLMTKCILKDTNGNPLSIVKGSADVIDIFATFYAYVGKLHSGDFYIQNFTTSAESTYASLGGCLLCNREWSRTTGANFLTTYSSPRGRTSSDSMSSTSLGGLMLAVTPSHSFDVANKKVTYTMPNIVSSDGNFVGGIGSLVFCSDMFIKLPTTGFAQPVLTKEVIGTGDGSTKDFNPAFGRIKNNGTFKVYVNDIEVTATADYGLPMPAQQLMTGYMIVHYPETTGPALGMYNWNMALTQVFENPFYALHPITSMYIGNANIYSSDDKINWTLVVTGSGDKTIPAEHKNKRYWKATGNGGGNVNCYNIKSDSYATMKMIHLETAPPVGATVSCTYQPDVIAKDANHVLNNISVALTFNEYAPT